MAGQTSDKPARVLLCEGLQADFVPAVAWVEQHGKVWFAKGGRSLTESITEQATIVESMDSLECETILVEGQPVKHVKDGRWFVEGVFQRYGVQNANGRKYSRKIFERIFGDQNSRQNKDIREGGMLGHLEHPEDGRTDGKKGAIVVRECKLRDDGVVWGKAELLDTTDGRTLMEYTRKGVRWGVSSRGNGSVSPNGDVNENDYDLITFDAVMRPSTPGAYPKPVAAPRASNESVSNDKRGNDADPARDTVSTAQPGSSVTPTAGAQGVPAVALSEAANELIASTRSLVESDVPSGARLASELTRRHEHATELEARRQMPTDKANQVRAWCVRKLSSMFEDTNTVASIVESASEGSAAVTAVDEKRDEAFRRVVRVLRSKNESLARELAAARSELAEKVTECTERAATLVTLKREFGAARQELQQALKENDRLSQSCDAAERELAAARDTIAEMSETEVTTPVIEAVEEAVRQHPQLNAVRALMESADSVEQVHAFVSLAGGDVERTPPTPSSASVTSASSPLRVTPPRTMVVESEAGRMSSGPATPKSAGASLAAKAVQAVARR